MYGTLLGCAHATVDAPVLLAHQQSHKAAAFALRPWTGSVAHPAVQRHDRVQQVLVETPAVEVLS